MSDDEFEQLNRDQQAAWATEMVSRLGLGLDEIIAGAERDLAAEQADRSRRMLARVEREWRRRGLEPGTPVAWWGDVDDDLGSGEPA